MVGPVWHGSKTDFDVFDVSKVGPAQLGFHFGDKGQAAWFGKPRPFYLDIRNPLRMPDMGSWEGYAFQDALFDLLKLPRTSNQVRRGQLIKAISDAGYDAIVYRNTIEGDEDDGWGEDSYVVFDPSQIHPAPENPLPVKESTRFDDLPAECPHGFWVTPGSDVHVVPTMSGHARAAGLVLGWDGDVSPLAAAYGAGWSSLVVEDAGRGERILWYRYRTRPTRSQLKTMKDLAILYGAELRDGN